MAEIDPTLLTQKSVGQRDMAVSQKKQKRIILKPKYFAKKKKFTWISKTEEIVVEAGRNFIHHYEMTWDSTETSCKEVSKKKDIDSPDESIIKHSRNTGESMCRKFR